MTRVLRILIVLVVVPATWFFIYWVPFSIIAFPNQRWIPALVSFLVAIGVGWRTWHWLDSAPDGLVSCMLRSAVIVGSIGFCAGFFGPILLAPEANQGPLLGIFITGPLGFLLGGVGGFGWWLIGQKRAGNGRRAG